MLPHEPKQSISLDLSDISYDPTSSPQDSRLVNPQDNHTVSDGGTLAWLQVLGSFFLWFNTWGLINCFGAFQAYYEIALLRQYSPSTIAWIGSVQSYLMLLVGAVAGPLFDMGYFRALITVGTSMVFAGMMLTSISHAFWQILTSQAICTGLGMGCLFVPSLAVLNEYFSHKRIFIAMGLAAAGSGLGGTLYPIIFHELQTTVGFAQTTRIIAFIAVGTLAVSNITMRVRLLPNSRRKLFDLAAWREPAFTAYVFGSLVVFLGTWTPFYYVEAYAYKYRITSEYLMFYLLPLITSSSILGRIVPNLIAARMGMFNIIIPCVTITGVLAILFILAKSTGAIVTICVLYGFFSGSCVSMIPALGFLITPDRETAGTRMGMACATIGLGMLAGTPLAGHILKNHGFDAMWAFSGAAAIAGAMLLILSRGLHGGWSMMNKT